VPIFRLKVRKNAFLAWNFPFFEQTCLLFARVDIGVTEFPTKIAEEEGENLDLRFFFQKWACASRFGFQWGIFIFLAA